MKTRLFKLLLFSLVFLFLIADCNVKQGSQGPASKNGTNGTNRVNGSIGQQGSAFGFRSTPCISSVLSPNKLWWVCESISYKDIKVDGKVIGQGEIYNIETYNAISGNKVAGFTISSTASRGTIISWPDNYTFVYKTTQKLIYFNIDKNEILKEVFIARPVGVQAHDMVYIPAGWFWMGCNPNNNKCPAFETPYHKVYLDAYYIDRNDVTVNEYTKCVNADKCTVPCTGVDCNYGVSGRENDPINCVDWNQANAYCKWKGGDLPTEAEWEKAARGTDGRTYPWGNKWDISNVCYNQKSTCAVGSYPQGASPYGVMDMAGNVYQWCSDLYDENYYANSPDHNPKGPKSGKGPDSEGDRVVRGGSWFLGVNRELRTFKRFWFEPWYRGGNGGFRCTRQVSK